MTAMCWARILACHAVLTTASPVPASAFVQGLAAGRVEFEVELLGFEEAHQQSLSGADKLERAARLKDQGNQLFKQARQQERGSLRHGASCGLFCCLD